MAATGRIMRRERFTKKIRMLMRNELRKQRRRISMKQGKAIRKAAVEVWLVLRDIELGSIK